MTVHAGTGFAAVLSRDIPALVGAREAVINIIEVLKSFQEKALRLCLCRRY